MNDLIFQNRVNFNVSRHYIIKKFNTYQTEVF